jgi:hypothetical protein
MLVALKPTRETIDLVAALGGKWHGSYAMCACPGHADRTPSLSIRQGERGILVHCFAGCRNDDVLRALARIEPIANSPEPDFKAARSSDNAHRIWQLAISIRGTIAEAYLRARSLPTDLADLRFHPRCPFGPKPTAVFRPALIVAVRKGRETRAIQRIALARGGVSHEGKYMLGSPGHGAWAPRLPGRVLAIAEGMEDAAAYTKLRQVPCWSALGAERISLVRIPEQVETLIIAADNNRPGRLAAQAAIEAHRAPGRRVISDPPPQRFVDWAEANEQRSR